MALTFSALGTPRVLADGDEVFRIFRSPSRCALLFVVALERETTRPALMGMFWPDADEDRARHALSQAFYQARKEFDQEILEIDGEKVRIAGDPSVDVHEFEARLARGEFQAARELYRGPFMEGSYLVDTRAFEGWVDSWRARTGQHARGMYVGLVSAAGAASRDGAEIEAARAWARHDPFDDRANSALIGALARSGQRAEALRRYEEYSRLLREELDIGPSDEVDGLVRRIRAGALPRRAPAPDPFSDEAPGLQRIRTLGHGSTAVVYLVREPSLDRLVAMKVLLPEYLTDPTACARFEREARSAARIHHPNVAPIYRTGRTPEGAPFLLVPYARDGTVADRLRRDPSWSPDAPRLVRQIASGLAAAHRAGVVHRDVRPANVLLDGGGAHAMLCDFGIAAVREGADEGPRRLTRTGELLGRPRYASPEQIMGEPVTDRADVYSLGITAYELLTGAPPFDGPDLAVLEAHLNSDPPPLPTRIGLLGEMVMACLDKDPRRRPAAQELADSIDR